MGTEAKATSSATTAGGTNGTDQLVDSQRGSGLDTSPDGGGDLARHARFRDWVAVCASVGLDEAAARRIWYRLQPIANDVADAGMALGMGLDACEDAAQAAVAELIRAELAAVRR